MKVWYTDIVIGNVKSSRQLCWCGSMAEQLICNQQVDGSTPFTSSINGGFPEWPKGTDCKSAALLLRWSESTIPHQKKALANASAFFNEAALTG